VRNEREAYRVVEAQGDEREEHSSIEMFPNDSAGKNRFWLFSDS
jgi:hypothetical protein